MKNLFIGTTPNIQKDDLWLILKLLLSPWRWRNDKKVREFESEVEKYLSNGKDDLKLKAFAFDSARTSFYQLLKAWGIGKGDEVLVPSFTCVVIINSVIQAGATPVYVDTDPKTYNMDFTDLVNKKTERTRVILVQHTFGIPMNVDKIRKTVGPDVKIVEDLAHVFGSEIKGRKLGAFGDGAVLTFGIEKAMTSLRGGMAVVTTEQQDSGAAEQLYTSTVQKLREAQSTSKNFSYFRIWKWLVNPFLWAIATPTYFWGIGKFTIGRLVSQLGHKLNLMGNMVEGCEYSGCFPSWMPARMPGAFAQIGLLQLSKLDKFNEHRRRIAKIYDEEMGLSYSEIEGYTPLRYPLLVDNPKNVHSLMRRKHKIIGNWYNRILFTDPKYLDLLGVKLDQIPVTVEITDSIINLPTFIKVSEEDAINIAKLVKPHLVEI